MPYSREKSIAGNADIVAAFQPWITCSSILDAGVFVGPKRHGALAGETQAIHFQELRKRGLLKSPDVAIVGEKRAGKSTLAKCLAEGLLSLKVTTGKGKKKQLRYATGRINDRRTLSYGDTSHGEYELLGRKLKQPSTELRGHPYIDIFDERMGANELDNIRIMVGLLAEVKRSPLTDYEEKIIQTTVSKITQVDRQLLKIGSFETQSRQITAQDVDSYNIDNNAKLREQLEALIKGDAAIKKELAYLTAPPPESIADNAQLRQAYLEAADHVSNYAGALQRGSDFGNVFGNLTSPYDLLTGRLRIIYWEGLPKKAAGLLEGLLATWVGIGERNGDNSVAPDFITSDEEASELTNLFHARAEAEGNRKSRDKKTTRISMYQYITDPFSIGEPNSELRGYGESIAAGMGMWLIGKQPNNSKTMEILTRNLGIKEETALEITELGRNVFAVVLPGEDIPVQFVQHVVLPSQMDMIKTEQSTEEAISDTVDNLDRPEVQERIEAELAAQRAN